MSTSEVRIGLRAGAGEVATRRRRSAADNLPSRSRISMGVLLPWSAPAERRLAPSADNPHLTLIYTYTGMERPPQARAPYAYRAKPSPFGG